jgi:cytochrome P450
MAGKADNSGIWIEGPATVNAGAMAAGPGASAVGSMQQAAVPADLDQLRAAIDTLIAQLQAAPAEVEDPELLAQVAASAGREVRKARPDKKILSGLLQAVLAGVTTSATLANAVVAIQHAISVLL